MEKLAIFERFSIGVIVHSEIEIGVKGDERENLKVVLETYERLVGVKGDDTWDEFLTGLLEGAPVEAETVELRGVQMNELARRLGDEVETRLNPNHH